MGSYKWGDISRLSILITVITITHISGLIPLITTHEPPSKNLLLLQGLDSEIHGAMRDAHV